MFEATRVFVITLGLAEVWYQRRRAEGGAEAGGKARAGAEEEQEEQEEEVLWRAVPSDRFDPRRHGFRVSSVGENLRNLRAIVALIRAHVPAAVVVFTLSPVPLSATFRGVSCVTANAASKAILRVAVDELLREEGLGLHRAPAAGGAAAPAAAGGAQRLFYWPAYEMVKEGFERPYLDDGRHVRPEVVRQILELFGKYYVPAEEPPGEAAVATGREQPEAGVKEAPENQASG